MPNVVENNCPTCYQKLPPPKHFLQPCDNELNYFMWMPGFEWKPEEEYDETSSEGSEESQVEKGSQEALEDLIEVDELKEKFDAEASGGYVSAEEAANVARSIGLAPSFADVDRAKQQGDKMNYTQFQQFCADCTHPDDKTEDLIQLFRHYDSSNTGKLSKKQIAFILTTWGEPLSSAEVEACMRDIVGSEDPVDYVKFVDALLYVENASPRGSKRSNRSAASSAADATSRDDSDSDGSASQSGASNQYESYQEGSDSSSAGDDSGDDTSSEVESE